MIKKAFTITAILVLGVVLFKTLNQSKVEKQDQTMEPVESSVYWTCPMHPQVHQDHPGECPICHMKLVKVEETLSKASNETGANEKRSEIHISKSQMDLVGIQKYQVEQMDLVYVIPVSGRLLSSTTVAFQLYENDLRYVHSGLKFIGEGSVHPDERISGIITSVDSIVDPTSRTVRVIGSLRAGVRKRIPETSFRGEIQVELSQRMAIPESSVLNTGKSSLVYVFEKDNVLKPKEIQLGIKTEGYYEVLSGLTIDDVISSGPNFLIDSEAKIRGVNQ